MSDTVKYTARKFRKYYEKGTPITNPIDIVYQIINDTVGDIKEKILSGNLKKIQIQKI